MSNSKKMGFNTKAIKAGMKFDSDTASLITPIYQTSTFVLKNAEQAAARFADFANGEESEKGSFSKIYTRCGNPTEAILENKLAILENGEACLCTSSGMGAICTTIWTLVNAGEHIVASDTLYGCSYSFLEGGAKKHGIDVTFVDASDPHNIEKAMKKNTKAIYIETPANPTLKIIDIEGSAKIAHAYGAKLIVDNTFSSPYCQRPLELGADVVIHSTTKYINGHGDAVGGAVISDKKTVTAIRCHGITEMTGAAPSPFNCWLTLRGVKTLGIRMKQHCENAQKVAEFLEQHPMIDKVYYPGLKNFKYHELAAKQMDAFGGMVSFEVKGGVEAGRWLMNHVKVCKLAVSLGDIETLVEHPASMTHVFVPKEERLKAGITDGFVRLSVGLEDAEDICADIDQGLRTFKG